MRSTAFVMTRGVTENEASMRISVKWVFAGATSGEGDADKGGLPGQWDGDRDLLGEIRFWVRIMREHALFMRVALPSERPDLVRQAEAFEERSRSLEERANRAAAVGPDLLRVLREAVHSLARLEAALGNEPEEGRSMLVVLRREVFWMRLMKEHVEFIVHMLDPSERALTAQGRMFRRTFVRLLQTAMDLESMAEAEPESFNTAARFIDEPPARTAELRDFKAAAYELLLMCQAPSVVPTPLLLDHVRREAERATVEACELRRPS